MLDGTRLVGARLADSNNTTNTTFAMPLTLNQGTTGTTDLFSDDDRSTRVVDRFLADLELHEESRQAGVRDGGTDR